MKRITSLEELDAIRLELPAAFVDYLDKYFRELERTLRSYYLGAEDGFSMKDFNEFVILEAGDSLLDIPGIGVQERSGRYFGSFEFVNSLTIDNSPAECIKAYMAAVATNNEFMVLLFVPYGVLSLKEEKFLAENVINSNEG